MRVLILSQYYAPEPIPKISELAEALRAHGDEVVVVTGLPNYPSGDLYPGYRLRLVQREIVNDVCVTRTFEFPYHGTNVFGRIANYGSFMLTAPLGALFTRDIDVMYVFHPPLTIGVSAWIISWIRRIPMLYDVQDLWPESVVVSGLMKPGLIVRLLAILERFVYRRATHLFVVTEGARQNVIAKGVPPEKVSVMPHWIDDAPFHAVDHGAGRCIRDENGWAGKFVVLFAGNLGLVQGLETIVHAAALLAGNQQVKVVFVGDGANRAGLQKLAAQLNLREMVQFIDRQPSDRMPAYMAAADALVVHLKASPLSNLVIPTKTLAYLASGRPIIMAMEGAAARLVTDAGAGRVVPPDDPAAMAGAIQELMILGPEARDAIGRSGQDFARRTLSRNVVIPQYRARLQELSRVARDRRTSPGGQG